MPGNMFFIACGRKFKPVSRKGSEGNWQTNPNGIQSFSPALTVRAGRARNGYAGSGIKQFPQL